MNATTLGLATALSALLAIEQILVHIAHPLRCFTHFADFLSFVVTVIALVEVSMLERVSVALALRTGTAVRRLTSLYWIIPQLMAIQDILDSYASTLKICAGCLALLFTYVLLFSIIAVECFSGLKFSTRGITSQSNFDTYFAAFELNMRLALGSPYIPVLRAIQQSWPACTRDPSVQGTLQSNAGIVGGKHLIQSTGAFIPSSGDCGSEYGWMYLFGLVAICRVCILPLSAATVVSALLENIDDSRSAVAWSDILLFQEQWQALDPDGRCPALEYAGSRLRHALQGMPALVSSLVPSCPGSSRPPVHLSTSLLSAVSSNALTPTGNLHPDMDIGMQARIAAVEADQAPRHSPRARLYFGRGRCRRHSLEQGAHI